MKSSLYIKTLKNINKILNKKYKRKAIFLLLFTIVNGFVEVIGLAFILPVLYLLSDPKIIDNNEYVIYIIDKFSFIDNTSDLISILIFMLPIVFILKNAFTICVIYFQEKFINNLAVDLIIKQYKNYLNKDYYYFKKINSLYVTKDISTVPTEFCNTVITQTFQITNEICVILFIVIGIGILKWKVMLLLFISIVPITVLFFKLIRNKISKMGNEFDDLRMIGFSDIIDSIFGIEDVKLYKKENIFIKKAKKALINLHEIYLKLNVIKRLPNMVIEISAISSLVILYLYFIIDNENKLATITQTLILFATAAYRIMPSINRIMGAFIDLKNKEYVFDTLLSINKPIKKIIHRKKQETLNFKNNIQLKNICFRYEKNEDYILENINLTIKKGEIIGLIGESGSGKSSLAKILIGFLKPSSGEITVDNIEINNSNIDSWKEKIGYVQQNFFMLNASLAENIAFAESFDNIDFKMLKKSIKLAELENTISNIKEGVDKNIGEFGNNLSGGQKQRIALARAFYRGAEILILDEATSSLDEENEIKLMKTLNSLKSSNTTIIIISHNLNSLKLCNKIYSVKDKKLKLYDD